MTLKCLSLGNLPVFGVGVLRQHSLDGAGSLLEPTGAAHSCWKSGVWVSVGLCAHPGGEPRRSCLAMGGLVWEGSRRLISL